MGEHPYFPCRTYSSPFTIVLFPSSSWIYFNLYYPHLLLLFSLRFLSIISPFKHYPRGRCTSSPNLSLLGRQITAELRTFSCNLHSFMLSIFAVLMRGIPCPCVDLMKGISVFYLLFFLEWGAGVHSTRKDICESQASRPVEWELFLLRCGESWDLVATAP